MKKKSNKNFLATKVKKQQNLLNTIDENIIIIHIYVRTFYLCPILRCLYVNLVCFLFRLFPIIPQDSWDFMLEFNNNNNENNKWFLVDNIMGNCINFVVQGFIDSGKGKISWAEFVGFLIFHFNIENNFFIALFLAHFNPNRY